jgi:site-specific DNA-methyltransferase (adenine-specific)
MNELMNRMNLMDCMEGMKQFPDKYFELAIVDPPYGIGVSNHSTFGNPDIIAKNSFLKKTVKPSEYKISEWDKKTPDKKYFDELFRISQNQIIWGVNYFDGMGLSGGRLFWDKIGTGNYSRGELAYLSFVNRIEYFQFKWCGMLQENMGKNKEKRIHPTQKPIALYRWILQNYAKPGDKIIDTHSGSGSLACACHLEKFDFLAIEKDEDYYKSSIERLETLRSQGTLF